jgi:thiamine kinase-like enzyme
MQHVLIPPTSHPAARAWCQLSPVNAHPTAIVVLKPEHRKSSVYRLEGAGPTGNNIIAKRCRRAVALIERQVYTSILPHVPYATLRYYGILPEPDDESAWIFTEDTDGLPYSSEDSAHRTAAALWLSVLHASAERLSGDVPLPERDHRYYANALRSARDTIQRSCASQHLQPDDLFVLRSIVEKCDVLESRWDEVERICEKVPRTLVHGDFGAKNVHVRSSQNGILVLPFDWEQAGWGTPATDLAHVDINAYWRGVHAHWLDVTLDSLENLANIGKLLWALAAIPGEAPALTGAWPQRVMRKMVYYHAQMVAAIQAVGW